MKYLISRVLCIHLPALNKKGLEGLYLTQIVKMVHTVTLGMMRTTPSTINYTNGVLRSFFTNTDKAITRELKVYIEEWEKTNINNKSQVSKSIFLAKYDSLDLYDEDMEKYLSLTMNNYNLIKLMGGI